MKFVSSLAVIVLLCGCEMAAENPTIVLPPSPAGFGEPEAHDVVSPSASVKPARDADEIAELKQMVLELKSKLCRPPDTTVEPKSLPDSTTAPVVFYFVAPFRCEPCDKMLKEIKDNTEFQWIKADASKWTGGFPAQQWQVNGQWLTTGIHKGWVDLNEFKAAFYGSLVQKAAVGAGTLSCPTSPSPPAAARLHYPIRGSWWTGCHSWQHLMQGEHAGKFNRDWLSTLSNAEIQSLHSDDHEGRVQWSHVVRPVIKVYRGRAA